MDDRKNEYPLWEERDQNLSTEIAPYVDKPKKKRHLVRFILLSAVLPVCISLTVFFLKFTVKILADDGKIGLSVTGKGEMFPADAQAQQEPVSVADTGNNKTPWTADDGSRMHISSLHTRSDSGSSLSEIYARVSSSVACIEATGTGKDITASGVVMSETGYIITNWHVINGAERIRVLLGNEEFEGVPVGSDSVTDLAVVKIEKDDCTFAEFADSDKILVGETVVAIGNPLGSSLPGTMTDGIICAINRNVTLNGHAVTLIQTNAALYEGSSGGPLINMSGQVIGINTVDCVNLGEDISGIGFALPSNFVKTIVDQLIENGYISGRPSLGIVAVDYDLPAQAVLFYGTPGGVLVSTVYSGSEAGNKGIKTGDIIVTVDGTDVYSLSDLTKVISSHQVGDTVTVVIFRSGRYYQADLTVSDEAEFKK